jgi:hypothetical protein
MLRPLFLVYATLILTYVIQLTCLFNWLMWRLDPLLGNGSVNTFLQEPTRAKVGRLLRGNGAVNTPKIQDKRRRCFPWSPPQGYITGSSKGAVSCQKLKEFSRRRFHLSQLLFRIGSRSGDGSLRRLRRNDKKGIRLR